MYQGCVKIAFAKRKVIVQGNSMNDCGSWMTVCKGRICFGMWCFVNWLLFYYFKLLHLSRQQKVYSNENFCKPHGLEIIVAGKQMHECEMKYTEE